MNPEEAVSVGAQIVGIMFSGLAVMGWFLLVTACAIYGYMYMAVRRDMTWEEYWDDCCKKNYSPFNTYYNAVSWLKYVGTYKAWNPNTFLVKLMLGTGIAGIVCWIYPVIRIFSLLSTASG